jgi:protoporphyrinogen oxidase
MTKTAGRHWNLSASTADYRLNDQNGQIAKPAHIAILGGGPAGLAVGYYAKKNQLPFTVYESGCAIGGNCITLKHGDFLFDSGAHRFHDKDVEATKEMKELLGDKLVKINAPSQIYYNGKFIDFPLSPLNLLRNLGLRTSTKAGFELALSRLTKREFNKNFEKFALSTYGKTIASYFLLNYSEKLWGVTCDRLSPNISGNRLKGLNLKTFLAEVVFGKNVKVEHLDGSFYYPKFGIGAIPEKLGEFCGEDNIFTSSKVTRVFHNYNKIRELEINGEKRVEVDEVVSTLPSCLLLQIMEPLPTEEVLLLARSLRYRNLILIALFLNQESVTENASIYFPDSSFAFTRVYEPRNRSMLMSPPGKTSLVAEIPCQAEDELWNMENEKLTQLVCSQLAQIGWITKDDVINTSVTKLSRAYPVLEIGYEDKVQQIFAFLNKFSNLKISGRNGKFTYTHIHDMMRFGKEIIDDYTSLD